VSQGSSVASSVDHGIPSVDHNASVGDSVVHVADSVVQGASVAVPVVDDASVITTVVDGSPVTAAVVDCSSVAAVVVDGTSVAPTVVDGASVIAAVVDIASLAAAVVDAAYIAADVVDGVSVAADVDDCASVASVAAGTSVVDFVAIGHEQSVNVALKKQLLIASQPSWVVIRAQRATMCLLVDAQHPSSAGQSQSASTALFHAQLPDRSQVLRVLFALHIAFLLSVSPPQHPGSWVVVGDAVVVMTQSFASSVSSHVQRFLSHEIRSSLS